MNWSCRIRSYCAKVIHRIMRILPEAVLCFLVLFHKSQGISDDAYNVLSTKLHGVSMEVDYLRKRIVSTNEKVSSLENKLEQGTGSVLDAGASKQFDDLTPHHMNNKTQIHFKIFDKAWRSEKRRARDFEEKLEEKLENTKDELGEVDRNLKLDIDDLKEVMNNTKAKLKGFSQRLDSVENDVGDLKAEQAILLARLQSEKRRFDLLESNFQDHKRYTESLRSELSNLKTIFNGKVDTLTTQLYEKEACQSGKGVGAGDWPKQVFPYRTTVKFNPPFKRTPAFVYGTVYLDTTTDTRYMAALRELTRDHFTIEMYTWGRFYLWGASVSWMACPK